MGIIRWDPTMDTDSTLGLAPHNRSTVELRSAVDLARGLLSLPCTEY